MKKVLICLVLITVSLLLTDEVLCQSAKPLWIKASLAGDVEQLIVSKSKNYFLTTEVFTPGYTSLRMWNAKNGSFIKALEKRQGATINTTYSSAISIPVNSANESRFCYAKTWYHAGRFNSEIPDSSTLYSYDFQDTLRLLFSRPVSVNATFKYSDDSKDIIVYDSGKARGVNSETGGLDYQINPYQVTDTLYSVDSSLKIFRKSGQYYNVSVDQRKSGVYHEVYSQDSVPGNFTISLDWKYLFLRIYYISEIEDKIIQLDSSVTNILSISHGVNFSQVAFSPDSKYLCRSSSSVYSDEDTITVWNLSTRTVQTRLFLHGDQKTSHYYFADSALYIASTQGPSNPYDGPPSLYRCQYPSFKDEEIVCASENALIQGISSLSSQVLTIEENAIEIWDLASGASLIQLVRKDTDAIPRSAHFSTTGDSIFAQYADGNILIWDSHAGNILNSYPPLSDDSGAVAYFSADCKYVCYEDGDAYRYNYPCRLVVWDLEKNKKVCEEISSMLKPFSGVVRFSPNDSMFTLSDMNDTLIRIYNTFNGSTIDTITPSRDLCGSYDCMFSPDSKKLFVWGLLSDCSSFESWDIDSSRLQFNVRVAYGTTQDMVFQPASNNLISNDPVGIISIPLDSITLEKYSILSGPAFGGENDVYYRNVTISEDGKYVACNVFLYGGFTVLSLPPISNSSVKYLPTSSNSEISIFPNPSTGILSVKLGANIIRPTELNIYDLLGRKVKNKKIMEGNNSLELNLSDLPSGSYVINVFSVSGIATSKFALINK